LARSGVLQKVRRLEEEEKARVQWQLDQAARERERLQRERQTGERERGVR
jgi:tRNA (Thr-GGU) A37 N-methylase